MEVKEILHPVSVEEAIEFLGKTESSKLLAGGTDLILEISREKLNVEYLVSLQRISSLKHIKEEANKIVIGSMLTFNELKASKIVSKNFLSLIHCAETMGSPQIRNMATIGGNIVNAASAADVIPCLMSLDATLNIKGGSGSRSISIVEYFEKYSENKLLPDEIIECISIEKGDGIGGFYKLGKRNSLAIARVSAALWIKVENNIVKEGRLALGAVGRYPFRLYDYEKSITGCDIEYLQSIEVLDIIENAVQESIKGRKTMPFKKEAVKGVYKQALNRTLKHMNI